MWQRPPPILEASWSRRVQLGWGKWSCLAQEETLAAWAGICLHLQFNKFLERGESGLEFAGSPLNSFSTLPPSKQSNGNSP